jgi:hypothetical protein
MNDMKYYKGHDIAVTIASNAPADKIATNVTLIPVF